MVTLPLPCQRTVTTSSSLGTRHKVNTPIDETEAARTQRILPQNSASQLCVWPVVTAPDWRHFPPLVAWACMASAAPAAAAGHLTSTGVMQR